MSIDFISLFGNPLFLAVVVLAIINIILIVLVLLMNAKMKKFLVGIDSKNISDSLQSLKISTQELQTFRKELEDYLTGVESRLKKSVQTVKTLRFNPFKGTGGGSNQSFATSFLNEDGDGVIISSLYSRDRVSVFAKPIQKNKSEYELTEEEQEVLRK